MSSSLQITMIMIDTLQLMLFFSKPSRNQIFTWHFGFLLSIHLDITLQNMEEANKKYFSRITHSFGHLPSS